MSRRRTVTTQRTLADMMPIPFRGGCNTYNAVENLPPGSFSMIQNERNQHPGFLPRTGYSKLHSTADGTNKVLSLYQFSKGRRTERHFFAQMGDDDVLEATNPPPAVTTGAFGSEVFSGTTGSIPASWSNMNDLMLFSNGVDQHQIYAGLDNFPFHFGTYSSATALPIIPVSSKDFTFQVTDGLLTTSAAVAALGTNATDCIVICSPVVPNRLYLKAGTANTAASIMTVSYYNGSWTGVSGFTDGTITVAGKTISGNGAITWTQPTDAIPNYMFGKSGFWLKITFSAALSAGTTVTECTYGSAFQPIQNVWDGVKVPITEARFFNSTTGSYSMYSYNSIAIGGMQTVELLTVDSTPSPAAWAAGATLTGATSNKTCYVVAKVTDTTYTVAARSGTFTDGEVISDGTNSCDCGTGYPTFTSAQSDYIYFNSYDNLIAFYTDTTSVPSTTAGVSISEVATWDGSAWVAVSNLVDGSAGFTKPGWTTFSRYTSAQRLQFQGAEYYSYWFRVKVTGQPISADTLLALYTMPYFSINDNFTVGQCSIAWKHRAVYSSPTDQFVYVSAQNQPMMLNGSDFGVLEPGDGRSNKPVAMRLFKNELMVWQEEKGAEGGCLTLFEGYTPETFGKLSLSTKLGTFNDQSVAVVENILVSVGTDTNVKTVVYCLSHYGVYLTDGMNFTFVSDDIRNYFDPKKTECIRRGYEKEMFLFFDASENGLRLGLVSGSSATTCNVFPFFDLTDQTWSFDKFAKNMSAMAEVEAGSGNVNVLQVCGGVDNGFVYQLNSGTTDDTTAIDAYATMEFDGGGLMINVRDIALIKSGSCNITPYAGGVAQTTHTIA